MNTHYLADYKDKFLAYYKGARQRDQNPTLMTAIRDYTSQSSTGRDWNQSNSPTGITKALAGLVEAGFHGVTPEDLPKVMPPDIMEPALIIMADVRAYFQGNPKRKIFCRKLVKIFVPTVAYKRIADYIPLALDHELVRGIERDVLQTLNTGLGISGSDGQRICKELAQENMAVAGRREELNKRLERLYAASEQLMHI